MSAEQEVKRLYGNRVRVRVCGLCIREHKILLINHRGVGELGSLWAPPGGGLEFGESAPQTLVREYQEETGLHIQVEDFLFIHELVEPPLQAVELFFAISVLGGELMMGSDPEMNESDQIIEDIRYWSIDEIKQKDSRLFHRLFRGIDSIAQLQQHRGYVNS